MLDEERDDEYVCRPGKDSFSSALQNTNHLVEVKDIQIGSS